MRRLIVIVIFTITSLGIFSNKVNAQTYCDPGSLRCSDYTHYQECGDNSRWGSSIWCGAGKHCSGGSCVNNVTCTCSGSDKSCNSSDNAIQCNGCTWVEIDNCNDSTEHCDGGACVANATDECSANQFLCGGSDGKTLLGCDTNQNPNKWSSSEPYADYCSYGCDSSTNPDSCIAAPKTPYCLNLLNKCGAPTCAADYQKLSCWNSYGDYLIDKEDGFATNPTSEPCVFGCGTTECHPTENWCIGAESPCPVGGPTLTEKWLDNCGGIDCKQPTDTSCTGLNPEPTPIIIASSPRCDSIDLSALPNPPVAGNAVTFRATTTSTNYTPDDAVERVEFVIDTGTSSIQITDDTPDYEATITPGNVASLTVTATGLFSISGATPCTVTQSFTPIEPQFPVNLQTYEVLTNSACTNPIALAGVIPEVRDNTTGIFESVANTNALGFTSFTGLGGREYLINMSKAGYIPQCGITYQNPRPLLISFTEAPPTQNFYFTRQALAWYQIVDGDVGAKGDDFVGNISSKIPTNHTFLKALTDGADSSGLAIAKGVVNIGDYGGLLGPSDREWSATEVNLSGPPVNGWFGYFERTFDQIFDKKWNSVQLNEINKDDWNVDNAEPNSYVLYRVGNLEVNLSSSTIPSGKYTVFVTGDLTVNSEIIIKPGDFLGFVVNGKTTFTTTTENIDGVYISDNSLNIENGNLQFNGQGIFVGMGGVNLGRNLNINPDDLFNNDNPAEKFTYRPDLLYNAPLGFKRIPLQWQEIEPTGSNTSE